MLDNRYVQLLVDNAEININEWIKQYFLWCTPQDGCLIQAACNLIESPELLYRSLSVVKILAELTLDTNLLVAGLVCEPFLNDEISNLTIIKTLGVKVQKLLLGIKKIEPMFRLNSTINYKDKSYEVNLRNLRKMSLTSNEYAQIMLIKIATQICVMRDSINADKKTRLQLAHQAQAIFAPLTRSLHIEQLNWELEDLAFKFLQPDIYNKIAKSLDQRRVEREKYILEIKQQLEVCLKLNGIGCMIFGRAKHIYSIWCKMQRKMVGFNEIRDVHAFRIIVPNVIDCYTALGVVHTLWRHVHNEFNDYISNPKSNGYKSLHTKIIGPDDKILEIQFRTKKIHQQAEVGTAAHWRYKDGDTYDY